MPSKSAKLKYDAMSKARKALRRFSGELAAPILVEPGLGLASDSKDVTGKKSTRTLVLFFPPILYLIR